LARQIANQGEGERAALLSVFRKGLSAADKSYDANATQGCQKGVTVFPAAHITWFPKAGFA
jgi:hypothetical protein